MAKSAFHHIQRLPLIGPRIADLQYPLERLLFYARPSVRRAWAERIDLALASADNALIDRDPNAGLIVDGYQIMHNGIRVVPGSYYGEAYRLLLMENRGVHEPQEERVFQEVLRWLPADAVMVEAGCYWAFYSMWFNKVVTRPRNIMIEPIPANLDRARQNFAANGMQGEYEEGFVGAEDATGVGGVPIVSVDGLARRHGLKRIDILHADVQGAELEMVQGADRLLSNKQVNWVFVSTHSEQLHADCLAALRAHSMKIVASHKPDESFSVDGLVVAKAPGVPGPDEIVVSKRRRRTASPKRDEEAGRI